MTASRDWMYNPSDPRRKNYDSFQNWKAQGGFGGPQYSTEDMAPWAQNSIQQTGNQRQGPGQRSRASLLNPGNPMSGFNPQGGPEFGIQNPQLEAQSAAYIRAQQMGMLPAGTTMEEFGNAYGRVNFKGQAFNEDHARQIMGAINSGRKKTGEGGEQQETKEQRRERLMQEKQAAEDERQKQRDSRLYEDAAGRDFQQQQEAIDRANQERRDYATGASDAIDQRIEQSQQAGEDLIGNAERLMERSLKEFDKMAKTAISDLNNQNLQYQAESAAGLRQSIAGQISSIDRDPTLTPAQKQQMKSQMQNQVSSQVATVVGQAQRETQQLRAQMRTAFSGQRSNLSQGMSAMVQSARVKAMEDNARSLEFAAQGRMALSELMSKPDRVLSEFDSLINIGNAMESQGLDFNAGRFARRFFENDQRSFADRMNDRAKNRSFV